MFRRTLLCLGLLAATPVIAQEIQKPLTGELELGVVLTSGNTETRSVNTKLRAQYKSGDWTHTGVVQAFRTENKHTTIAERYTATAKSDYYFNPNDYLFGRIWFMEDRFSGYEYQASQAVGYGRRLVQRPDLTFDLEAGMGARQNRLTYNGAIDETIVFGSGKLGWQLSESALLTGEVSTESGATNTRTDATAALKLRINGHLALKLSHNLQHNTSVPEGVVNANTITGVTLVIDY